MADSISFRLVLDQGRRYDVGEAFAAGGVATVHLARYVTSSGVTRTVAVKKLHAHVATDPEFRTALLDEARIVARIHHPNVVAVLDVVEDEDGLFLAMEYVHGVSFDRLLQATRPERLDPSIACAVVAGALKGLHAAHESCTPKGTPLNLVHRDVSPQNILVGVDGITRMIDFGLAYALGRSQATKSGIVKGKPSYMSPEQVRGERVTRRSDIFSMGATLWGALTGRKLFEGEVIEATLFKVLNEPIPKPSSIASGIPPELDAIVMRALERSPSSRFPTALEMARAIEAAVAPPLPGVVGEWVEEKGVEYLADMKRRLVVVESGEMDLATEDSSTSTISSKSIEPSVAERTVLAKNAVLAALPVDQAAPDAPRRTKRAWIVASAVAALAVLAWAASRTGAPTAPEPSTLAATPPSGASVVASEPAPPAPSAVPTPPSTAPVLASATIAPPRHLRPKARAPAVEPRAVSTTTTTSRKKPCLDPLDPRCN